MVSQTLEPSLLKAFMPHGMCLLWRPDLLLVHVISDALIAASYYSIPVALVYFVLKRRDLQFRWIFILFGIFIMACGTTHLMEIWTIWQPVYWPEGIIKAVTAAASIGTALVLWPLIPAALRIPSPAQLKEINLKLQHEIEERGRAEQAVRLLNEDLEKQVERRTQALAATNRQLAEEIQERHRIEQSLRESEERYRTLFEQMPDAVVLIDAETGKIIDFNRKAHENLGYGQEEFRTLRLKDICWLESERAIAGLLDKVRLQGSDLFDAEHRTKGGDIRDVRVNAKTVHIHQKSYIQAIWTDITESKRAQAQLEEAVEAAKSASRAKSQFLAHISHELRTPLNNILGFTQLLQKARDIPHCHKESLTSVRRSGEYLLTLINDILDLSKIEAGKLELTKRLFNFADFLAGITEIFALRAKEKGIAFSYQKLGELPSHVYGDDKRLRQMLINLLSNAVKFTQEGRVTFTVHYCCEDTACFQVEDTGSGIAPDDLERIFLPFEQLRHPQSSEGTGLGLAISKRLIESMEGQLQVQSEIGKGSLFQVTLPLPAAPIALRRKKSQPAIIGYEGKPRKILIVDDNRDNLALLEAMLKPLGFTIRAVRSGQECLEAVKAFAPELILMDILMPQMDGFETLQRLRESASEVPVMAVTAHAFEETKQVSLASGFADFISKPIRMEDLLRRIQKQLGLAWRYELREAPEASTRASRYEGLSFLIADGSEVNRALFKAQLADTQAAVTEAKTGPEALEKIRSMTFDMIFLALQLPSMTGIQVWQQLQARSHQNPNTPVIAVTDIVSPERKKELLAAGFLDLLPIPFSEAQLNALIDRFVTEGAEHAR